MMHRDPIRILIAQFEDIVARGLRALIDEDENLELLGDQTAPELVAGRLAQYRPDVAILNYGSLQSPAEIRELARCVPETRLIVLANRPTTSECRQMLAFGATACLAKNTEARDILHAIHLASRGLHVLPPVTRDGVLPDWPEELTPREADVLELLQAGRSNAEIAHALHVSIETVRTHVRRIYRKLGVKTRRELRVRA